MTNIQAEYFKRTNRKAWQCFLWEKLLDQFFDSSSGAIFNSLFSVYEKKVIANRLAAMILIRQGVGTREIGRLLWISRSTISSLRKMILSKSKNYTSPRFSRKSIKRAFTARPHKITPLLNFDFLKGVSILELLKNPPSPKGLGITGRGITR